MRLKQPTYFVRRQLSDSRPVLVYQIVVLANGNPKIWPVSDGDATAALHNFAGRPDDHPVSSHLGWASSSRFDRFYRREKGTVDAEQDGSFRGSIPFPGNYLWGATIHAWPINGALWLL